MNFLALTIASCLLATGFSSQEAPPDTSSPEAETETAAPLTLDELLGLETDRRDAGRREQARENEQELDRRLNEAQLNDLFTRALEKMSLSARLLDVELDSGLGTQRAQLDVLAKLDQLIDMARQMSQQQMGSSGSSGGSKQQPQPQPGAQQRRDAASGQRREDGGQDGVGTEPPPRRDGDVNTILEETETEWGHLPARIREMMKQGRGGEYSRLYQRLTEDYYKRLAEDGSR